jgi:hypothetical protein
MRFLGYSLFLSAIILIATTTCFSQSGWSVGINFPSLAMPSGDVSFQNALQGELYTRYRVNGGIFAGGRIGYSSFTLPDGNVLALYRSNSGQWYASKDWTYFWFSADGGYQFTDSGTVRPYVLAHIGFVGLFGDYKNSVSGLATGGEIGLNYFLDQYWSLEVNGGMRFLFLTSGSVDGNAVKLASTLNDRIGTAGIGIVYHFNN